jgi:hypothetical protein
MRPIPARIFFERLTLRLRLNTEPVYSGHFNRPIEACLSACKWNEFYDSIEMVAEYLIAFGSLPNSLVSPFPAFQTKLNTFFADGNCGWQIDEAGNLQRCLPKQVTDAEIAIGSSGRLTEAVKTHVRKARAALERRPYDFANSIKESVSAIESAGKSMVSGASTLGDVIKALKRRRDFPLMMADVIDKLYVFSNAEPGIRHAGVVSDRIQRADAEFAYSIALSILLYLRNFEA